jgi:aspartyl-tRNA(Asn)/glutamyl-tRNA(Gln) amidotransferase subunit C
MKLDRSHIDHVAKLASLSLTNDEAERMTRELGAILGYVEELSSVDTSSVEATAQVLLSESAWRPDVAAPGLTHEEALAQAPRAADDGFAVPTFVEADGSGGGKRTS